jgi:iron complex transport system substrate-binding protein
MIRALLALALLAGPAAAPPQRVVSLNLTADEVLVEILPAERLLGVTAIADENGTSNVVGRVPPAVTRFPKVDLERLLALRPDLVVLSEYTDADARRLLETSGVRIHRMTGLVDPAGYRKAILELGRAVGAEPAAGRLVARYDGVYAALGRRLAGVRRPRVLYWAQGMTAGRGTAIGALIESAGGINAAADAYTGIAPVGAERVFVIDPDVILIGTWDGTREALTSDPLLSQMRAVKEGRVVEMPTELLVALSHHAADASWHLAWRLHPGHVPTRQPGSLVAP